MRCDNKLTARLVCRSIMQDHIDHLGRVTFTCVRCEAVRRGLCWSCGKVRGNDPSRGKFCAGCAKRSVAVAKRRYRIEPAVKERQRRYDQRRLADPAIRERRRQQRAAWFARHPEKVEEYKRKDSERHKKANLQRRALAQKSLCE